MKNALCLMGLMLMLSMTYAQNTVPVSYRKTFGGYVFEQNGKALKPRQMLDLFETNEAAYEAMKKAKSNYDPAVAMGFVGGALIGWPLGTAIGGGDPEWALAGIGAGLIILAIPLNRAFNKHAVRAVDLYNGNDSGSARLHYGITEYGIGLQLKF